MVYGAIYGSVWSHLNGAQGFVWTHLNDTYGWFCMVPSNVSHSICSHYISTVRDFQYTMAIMQEKQHNPYFKNNVISEKVCPGKLNTRPQGFQTFLSLSVQCVHAKIFLCHQYILLCTLVYCTQACKLWLCGTCSAREC